MTAAGIASWRSISRSCGTSWGGSGREIKTTRDGFLATFDGPARAIRAAQAIRAELTDHGLQVRVGLHTGEVELVGDDIGGIAVHTAARCWPGRRPPAARR
jgi:class 3 adenylate cyclase